MTDVKVAYAPPDIEEARDAGALILVAEDIATNQYVLRRILERLGYAHEIVDNGRLALQKYRSGNYGLLLTDFHMPEMDGFELTDEIRRHEAQTGCARMPIVAVTADALTGMEARCHAAGMDDFLAKPIDLKSVATVMEKWLPQAAALRRLVAQRPGHSSESDLAAQTKSPLFAVDERVLDTSRLAEAFDLSGRAASEFLLQFIADTPRLLTQVDTALSGSDANQAFTAAHALKGAARSAGAVGVAQLVDDVQMRLKDNDFASAKLLATLLSGKFSEFCAAVRPKCEAALEYEER